MLSSPAAVAVAFSSLRAGLELYERPYLGGAAESDGRKSAGEVEDGVGFIALEHVEGAEAFPRFGGGTIGLHDLVSVEANGRCCPRWP